MKRLDRYRLKNPDFYAVQYDGLNGEDLAADLVLLGIKLFGWWEVEGEIGMETGKNACMESDGRNQSLRRREVLRELREDTETHR